MKSKSSLKSDLHESVLKKKIAIVASAWHHEIVDRLLKGARKTLEKAGIPEEHVQIYYVPGSYELPQGAQATLEIGHADAVVCLGVIIRGETPHFEYIAQSVAITINQVSLRYNRPVSFGVLTVENVKQAEERAGGKHGNKGEEAAQAVLEMLSLHENIRKKAAKKTIGFGG